MKFDRDRRTELRTVGISDYFDHKCSFCDSKRLLVRTSRYREIIDLGTALVKVMTQLEVVTFKCKDCKVEFTPQHPDFPTKYEYSLDVIEHALLRYHYQNASGLQIATDLQLLHFQPCFSHVL